MTIENIGPFQEYYKISIDGYVVPKIKAYKSDDGKWSIVLDGRFGISASEEDVDRWMHIVANAMAIGAGYSSFGESSQKMNPYSVKIVGLYNDELDILNDGGEIER